MCTSSVTAGSSRAISVTPSSWNASAGGIVEKEAPIQASNVGILNPETNKADRVGFKILEDKTKVRVFKSTGEVIDG